jgi:ABC-type glycerol-3-phosphate transport system substrate-binding protein
VNEGARRARRWTGRWTRRHAAGFTAALGAAGLQSACGALPGGAPPGDQSRPPVTLELWGLPIDPHVQAYEAILKDWEAGSPKETINPVWATPGPGDYLDTKLTAAVAAGSPPELSSQLGRKVWVQAAQNWYQPVDDVFRTARIDPTKTFYESALTPWQLLGKTYGLPLEDNAAGFGIALRADLFQEAGVPVPTQPYASYDEAYDAARRVARRQGADVVRGAWSTNLGWLMCWVFGAMLEAGQPYFDPKSRRFQVSSPAGVDVLEKLVAEPTRLGLELPGLNVNEALSVLEGGDGRLAMTLANGPGLVRSALLRNLDTAPHLRWLLRPPFRGQKRYFVGEAGWGVVALKGARQQDRVAPFLAHVAGPAAQRHWSVVRGCPPGASAAPHEAPECKAPELADQRTVLGLQRFDETWRYYGPVEYGRMDAAYAAVGRAAAKVRRGEVGARQAAQEIDEELHQEVAKFYELMRGFGVAL